MQNGAKCTVISVVTLNGMHNINYVGFCEQKNVRISEASLRISATLWPNVKERDRFELPEYPNLRLVKVGEAVIRIPKYGIVARSGNRIGALVPCG